ncbi:MAG TPA: signal peptidase I [Anaerolineae bacterium]|nr:signal peptidase I [Anaerolineae bacterium]
MSNTFDFDQDRDLDSAASEPNPNKDLSGEPRLPGLTHALNQSQAQSSHRLLPEETDSPTPATQYPEPLLTPPSYRVSSAEPGDFSNYTLPSLEEPEEPEPESSRWQAAWSILREVGETVILTLVIFLLIQMVVRNFRVVGTSMVNNLHNGQYLIIDKLSYNSLLNEYVGIGGPQRGDVIVFKPPRNPNEDYVKRIIGLAGEEVQVIQGQVFINGQPLDEPFEPVRGTYTMPVPVVVPAGQVFVLGDNRNNSNDSHNWGPLPIENIIGRAWISYWPPDLWGSIPRDAPTEDATLKHIVGQFVPSANAKNK